MRPKPLPAGRLRLQLLCTCGRRVPAAERIVLYFGRPCPDCGGRSRSWWRRPVTSWERFTAWLALRRWRKEKGKC